MAEKINVLIADDHAIVRQGLKQILSETEDMLVTGEADDGAEALSLARQQPWDVFLLDVSMPNRNGIDTLKQLKKEFPRLPVLILSMHPEEQYAVRALKAEAISDNTEKSPHERITDREYQVLVMIAAGKTLTQVAEQLNLGVATVSTYRARLLEKMGLKSTAELIRYGLEHGLAK